MKDKTQSQHTSGPWKIYNDENPLDFSMDYWINGLNGEIVCSFGVSRENARRIVACVNACEGVSTEFLETLADMPEKNVAKYEQLLKQRDELLEAAKLGLRIAEHWIQEEYSGTGMLDDVLAELEPIRAVIAKATGGQS
jgi:hypothetical protein